MKTNITLNVMADELAEDVKEYVIIGKDLPERIRRSHGQKDGR